MRRQLDGPSAHTTLTVTNSAVQEIKVGASPLEERSAVTIQADQSVYVYWGDGSGTPSSTTVAAQGVRVFKNQLMTFEAGSRQDLYIRAITATASVKVVERG